MSKTCLNCGQPIEYHVHEGIYCHQFGRWEGDNGYWCFENDFKHSANGNSREEQNMIDDGWYIYHGGKDGLIVRNAKTREERSANEMWKFYGVREESR